MSKLIVLSLILFSLSIATSVANAKVHNPDETWFQNLFHGKQKMTKLHFYIQDALSGPNATVWEVSTSLITSTSSTSFGQVRVLDDLITATPDPSSTKLGRAQGLITSSDLDVSALNMNLNIVFTAGKYNGSTVTILGRNQILNTDRELPVVGGTGLFRMARGFAISNTYLYDGVLSYGVLEYTIYVVHTDMTRYNKIKMVSNM